MTEWHSIVGLAMLATCTAMWASNADVNLGRQIFIGEAPITARLAGHGDALPTFATRCVNCHHAAEPGASSKQTFGPVLNANTLANHIPRRGGPPSKYDPMSLCKLLRDGIDPAWVMVPTAMPRYEITDAQCAALWAYMTLRTP